MLIATMKSTANGIYDKDPDTEEPDECESLKSGAIWVRFCFYVPKL